LGGFAMPEGAIIFHNLIYLPQGFAEYWWANLLLTLSEKAMKWS